MNKNTGVLKGCFLIPWLFVIVSCASTGFKGNAELYGRIYGTDGKGISQMKVSVDGKNWVLTDERGMFVFENQKAGMKKILSRKTGFCGGECFVNFSDRKQFVCMQVISLSELFEKAEKLLKLNMAEEAVLLLKKEKEKGTEGKMIDFYIALAEWLKSHNEVEKEKLLAMAQEGDE